eukprot:CAMPEP_0194547708 /NCGR_PEP_ID=MMETSP0253-20130528/92517_1 /TAXON_ID=2966 /ORGANISM="Noctiluca scintillans" /LENGTH=228 /DNA_ID=CAMNT_0039394943 /DNA_START=150 /DNA_END=835 /DNA_ORIENTATION=+
MGSQESTPSEDLRSRVQQLEFMLSKERGKNELVEGQLQRMMDVVSGMMDDPDTPREGHEELLAEYDSLVRHYRSASRTFEEVDFFDGKFHEPRLSRPSAGPDTSTAAPGSSQSVASLLSASPSPAILGRSFSQPAVSFAPTPRRRNSRLYTHEVCPDPESEPDEVISLSERSRRRHLSRVVLVDCSGSEGNTSDVSPSAADVTNAIAVRYANKQHGLDSGKPSEGGAA